MRTCGFELGESVSVSSERSLGLQRLETLRRSRQILIEFTLTEIAIIVIATLLLKRCERHASGEVEKIWGILVGEGIQVK